MHTYLLQRVEVRVGPSLLHAFLPHEEVCEVHHPVPVVVHARKNPFDLRLVAEVREHARHLARHDKIHVGVCRAHAGWGGLLTQLNVRIHS